MVSLEADIKDIRRVQASNHADNRQSIHDIRDNQQTQIDQQAELRDSVVTLKTKMDMVVGSDHGKPGILDEMRQELKAIPTLIRNAVGDIATEVKSNTNTINKNNWIYELGKMVVFAGAAAAAAHFSK